MLIEKLFLQLQGKYSINRIIGEHGIGKGLACFTAYDECTLQYKEELEIKYHGYDQAILGVQEYKYILEKGQIFKYFCQNNNKDLFYQLNFYDSSIGLLSKLDTSREFEGDTEPLSVAYSDVREDSSTGSMYKLSEEVGFRKKSIAKAEGIHLCKQDFYSANYVFFNENFFTLNYQILGPNKNWSISTEFIKIPSH